LPTNKNNTKLPTSLQYLKTRKTKQPANHITKAIINFIWACRRKKNAALGFPFQSFLVFAFSKRPRQKPKKDFHFNPSRRAVVNKSVVL
jgi:hypothetical protein